MLHVAFFMIAFKSIGATLPLPLSTADALLRTSPEQSAAASPGADSRTSLVADNRLSIALVFDDAVAATVQQEVRSAAEVLKGMELQPQSDTLRLLRGLECADQWLSCQILAGHKLGVEKMILVRFLSEDALALHVVDVDLEISRGEIVIPWFETSATSGEDFAQAQRTRVQNALLVLLREKPVLGELLLRGKPDGRVRIDGLIMSTADVAEQNPLFTLPAGSHLIEIENERGEWKSAWIEIPGESRLELPISSDAPTRRVTASMSGFEVESAPAYRAALFGAGAVTLIGAVGFLGVTTFISQEPVMPGTSTTEVSERLGVLEMGQNSAWVLGGLGLGMVGWSLLWEIFENQVSEPARKSHPGPKTAR